MRDVSSREYLKGMYGYSLHIETPKSTSLTKLLTKKKWRNFEI